MPRRPSPIALLTVLHPGNDTSSHPPGEPFVSDSRRRSGSHAAV